MLKIIVVIILCVFGPVAFAAHICDKENQEAIRSGNQSYSSLQALLKETSSQSKLHVFGDVHFNTDRALIASIVKEFATQSGPRSCLFLELPVNGRNDFNQAFRNAYSLHPDSSMYSYLQPMWRYYNSFYKAAVRAGLAVFEVDELNVLKKSSVLNLEERNIDMAKNIQKRFNDGSCAHGMVIVGKAHISAGDNGSSLISELHKLGARPATYNVIGPNQLSEGKLLSWDGLECTKESVFPFAFRNTILNPSTLLFPNDFSAERQMLWSEFDYTILAK